METRDVVVELLSQLGGSREAREYLNKFQSRDSTQFAVVKVGGEILINEMQQLASALGFLFHVGLFPVVLHGAGRQLDVALEDAQVVSQKLDGIRVTTPEVMSVMRPVVYQQNIQLVDALERLGIRSRSVQHGVFECDFLDQKKYGLVGKVTHVTLEQIRSAIHSGALPIVTCLGETAGGQVMNINADIAAAELVLEIEPQKIIFLTPTGGLLNADGRIISAISLASDYERLMEADWVHSGMRVKLQQIAQLLKQLPVSSSVSITSAANLTKELFTHRGAGTLIRQGEVFDWHTGIHDELKDTINGLLHQCFGRSLKDSYFAQHQESRVIQSKSGRATAVLQSTRFGVHYLDKIAVTPVAQGEGLGASLWEQIRESHHQLYWRSKTTNPINGWYAKQADFCCRRDQWIIYGYGIDDWELLQQLCLDAVSRPEYWNDSTSSEMAVS